MCKPHRQRLLRTGDVNASKPLRPSRIEPGTLCSIDGCKNLYSARGLCSTHRVREKKYGDPLGFAVVKGRRPNGMSVEEAFRYFMPGDPPDHCWIWTGRRNMHNYGTFTVKGKPYGAHRVAYEVFVGPIPDGLYVCHHCDNPPCVNPKHLHVGTAKDNHADMDSRGRRAKVHRSGPIKLTMEQVREIQTIYAAGGVSQRELAKRYPVSKSTIGQICRGLSPREAA